MDSLLFLDSLSSWAGRSADWSEEILPTRLELGVGVTEEGRSRTTACLRHLTAYCNIKDNIFPFAQNCNYNKIVEDKKG